MTIRILLLIALFCISIFGTLSMGTPSTIAASAAQSTQVYVPGIANGFCGPFFDPFNEPTIGWINGPFGDLSAEFRDGEYRLMFAGRGMVWLVPGPVCEHTAYRAAVDVRWVGQTGNFAGLLFNFDEDSSNGYLFAINTDGRLWLVFEVVGESLETIIAPVHNSAILQGTAVNRLAVERVGNVMTFFVNDTSVGELRDSQPGSPVIAGVAAASYTTQDRAEARFDNFSYAPIAPTQ